MLCLTILFIIWASCSYLFSLISTNPWFWFLWIPLGFIATVLIFVIWLYGVALPILGRLKTNSKLKGMYAVHVIKMVNILGGVKLKVEGKENLTPSKRVLYVSNHKSNIDPCLIYQAANRTMTAAGKSSLWKIKPLLPLIKAFQVIKINRENDREAAKSIIEGIKYMKNDNSVIIFPEGGIKTREVEQMVSIKPGAYKLATKSDAVIQPIAIIGASKISKRKWYQPRVKVIVRFLPAINPEDYRDLNTHEIAYKVVELVNANFPNEAKYVISEEA